MFDSTLYEIAEFNYLKVNLRNKVSGQIKTTCPHCTEDRKNKTDKSLSVNVTTGEYNCHHCSKTGNIHKWRRKGARKTYVRPQWKNKTELSDKLVKYFEGRAISQKTLELMKITEEMEWMPQTEKPMNCVVFNYFYQGELINKKYRTGGKHFKLVTDAEKILYNLDSVFEAGNKSIAICEGCIDALSYIESGINFAVSVPNGASTNTDYLDNYMPLFSHIEKVYLATDNDTKGLILRGELLRRFGAERCYKVDFEDCKDANEYLLKYGRTALAQTLDSAKRFPFEGLVTVLDIEEELNDLYENGIGTGYNFGDEQLDKICRVDLGKLLVLTGIPSHGKTTALNYLITKLNITQGWKTAFYSPESFPVKMHVSKMEELLVGKRFSGERRMSRVEHQAAMQYMNDNFFFIQPEERKTLENILKSARQAVRAYGVKVIVIDPWNRLDEMSDDTNAIGREINKVSNFAAENNVLAIIVAHPTKLKKKDKSMYYEEPTPYDIKGSSCWYDMPDIILTWHRDFDHDYNQLRVYKVREEYLGQPGALRYKYNINNRRISSINDNLGAEVPLLWDNRNWLTGEGNIVRDNQMSDLEYLQTPIKRKYDTPINFYEPTQAGDDPDRPPF